MSGQKMQPVTANARDGKQTVESYQPLWMNHWMRPGRNVAADGHTLSVHGKEEVDRVSRGNDLKNGWDACSPAEELRDIETRNFAIVTSTRLKNEKTCWSLMNQDQYTDDKETLRQEFGQTLKCGKAGDWEVGTQFPPAIPNVKGAVLKECNSLGEGTTKTPEGILCHISAKDMYFSASRPPDKTAMRSSTHDMSRLDLVNNVLGKAQDGFNKGKSTISPLFRKPLVVPNNYLPCGSERRLNQGHGYNHRPSADLICYRKRHSDPGNAMKVPFRELNSSLLFDAPSTSDHPVMVFGQDWFQKMQNHPGIGLLPSQCVASETTELKKPCFNSYSLQKLQKYAHDMKTMRVCTTVDSVEESPGRFPRFSQTTHSLLITKDANLSEINKGFRSEEFITGMNRNTSRDIHSLLPFSGQCSRGVQLQSLSSSSSGEGKRKTENLKPSKVIIKNESSADTDIMDVDLFKEEISTPGSNYTSTNKDFSVDLNLSPWMDAGSSRKLGGHRMTTTLPDIPAILSANEYHTSSRTHNLEMEIHLAHPEQPKQESTVSNSRKADPTMRWIKRLKLGSSNAYSQGTRSSNLDENSSPDKKKKYFQRILQSRIASPEPSPRSPHTQGTIMSYKNVGFSNNDKNIVANPSKKGKELLLSQSWIKRLLRDELGVTKKPGATAVCEPQKLPMVDFPKNPSIAAMALMGKAMNGLHTCELQRRDSLTVWNTKAF